MGKALLVGSGQQRIPFHSHSVQEPCVGSILLTFVVILKLCGHWNLLRRSCCTYMMLSASLCAQRKKVHRRRPRRARLTSGAKYGLAVIGTCFSQSTAYDVAYVTKGTLSPKRARCSFRVGLNGSVFA